MKMNFKSKNKFVIIQTTVIVFIWILLLAVPVLFGNFPEERKWVQIFKIWKEYVFLFFLFLINRFVLLPYLFFRRKRAAYFILTGALVLVLFSGMYLRYLNSPQNRMREIPPIERPKIRPPRDEFRRMPEPIRRDPLVPPYANLLILSFLILGFDTGLNMSIKWLQSEQRRIKLEKENMENKLAFLQNQVSPHFFLNTLNNIHALVDINTEEAKEAIIKLSRLMGYLLYESRVEKISIEREIQFIRSYVELMRLRFSEKVEIKLQVPYELPKIKIHPLLFISCIENAFKHGISYESESFVDIVFEYEAERLIFEVKNSNHNRARTENSGIGLENIKNRLDLLYGDDYLLNISESQDVYKVKMEIPI